MNGDRHDRPGVLLAGNEEDLRQHDRPGLLIVPVTLDAQVAIHPGIQGKVEDVNELVSGWPEFLQQVVHRQFRAEKRISSLRPAWLSSFSGMEIDYMSYQVVVWHEVLTAIHRRLGGQCYVLIPPGSYREPSMPEEPFWKTQSRKSFLCCVRSLKRRKILTLCGDTQDASHRPAREAVRLIRRAWEALPGSILGVLSDLFLIRPCEAKPPDRKGSGELLLAGVQLGDGLHQAPLAECLYRRFQERFLWVAMHGHHPELLTNEELSLLEKAPLREHYRIDPDEIEVSRWRRPTMQLFTDSYLIWRVARILSDTMNVGLSRADWYDWLESYPYRDFCRRYEKWDRFLSRVRPKLIVANSSLQEMAFIRAWARRHHTPFFLLPHGIVHGVFQHYDVDGDWIAAFGPRMRQQFEDSGLREWSHIRECGPMQFSEKSSSTSNAAMESGRPNDEKKVLYLGAVPILEFSPTSPGVALAEVETLAAACRRAGHRLVIREHPRNGQGVYKALVSKLEAAHPGWVSTSCSGSIVQDIKASGLVVASHFDGGLIDALFQERPVIAYIHPMNHIHGLDLLEESGLLVRSPEELERVIGLATEDQAWVTERLEQQRRFRDAYMGTVEGNDPWAAAMAFIEEACKSCGITGGSGSS